MSVKHNCLVGGHWLDSFVLFVAAKTEIIIMKIIIIIIIFKRLKVTSTKLSHDQ